MKTIYFTFFILLIALSIRAKVVTSNESNEISKDINENDDDFICFTTEIDDDEETEKPVETDDDLICFTTEIDDDEETQKPVETDDDFICFTTEIDDDEETEKPVETDDDLICFTTEIDDDEETEKPVETDDDLICFTTEIDDDEETQKPVETDDDLISTTEIIDEEETETPSSITQTNEKEEETEKVTETPKEEEVNTPPSYYEEEEEEIDFEELLKEGFDEEDIEIYKNYENLRRNVAFNGERLLDVYYDKYDTKNKKPVVIFIYGGSWVSGNKLRYTKFGVLLEQNNYVGVVPNYELFPQGTVEDMVEDVYNIIHWTYQNIERYGGDPKRIILTAHSAGAHISALTIVKSVLHQKNNGIQLEDLPYLEKAVLMNGPYVLNGEVVLHTVVQTVVNFFKGLFGKKEKEETKSGADTSQNGNIPKFILKYFNDNKISPTNILKKVEKNGISNHFNIGKFNFFYTSEDESVPESSAKNLIKEIERTSPDAKCEYYYREGLKHATLIYGIRDGNPEYENIYLDLIRN
ncbi:hypothetical protein BCR32DRAFT_326476 [Anaeromyces robustus]|jgi:hypothetical protein|uniref:BD-FAE-like domain-containing protein n=1 Tax=Anaeromyces robustus TaxID=1754192 RepID=A0A1Y1XBX4_9FUNG|nr:hypothetical protein BCR32DRAFT_326476 [Anaeromyces robustus]|eukprot:ORX83225.1 hypothetical protein BCR32DRAFT_326476 [Anaeromyces robustus]